MNRRIWIGFSMALLLVVLGLFVACSSSNSFNGNTSQMATVNVSVSDPPTCAAPSGPYAHVWVTIKDVKIHQSASAGPNDSGWIDLTPNLSSSPQQIDLLGIATNNCFLAMLGSKTEIQAGTYQQIRVYLSDDSDASKLMTNNCNGNHVNCVVMAANGSPGILNLSSEAQTGIKIPPGQLAGGQFTVAAGDVKDLNIDFDACASIVRQGNGQFRLKPVLHAGEVHLTSTSITGKLVDSTSMTALLNATAVVAIEQKDASGIDRVIMQTAVDAGGNFVLCPVPTGTYDVVAVAVSSNGVAYAATITTGVQPGNALGNVPMVAQLPVGGSTANATIQGDVTSSTGSAGTAADITLFAMQQVNIGGSAVNVIIPVAQQWSAATANFTTSSSASCATSTADCFAYTIYVPAMWPNIGAYASSGAQYTQSTATPVTYTLGADAFVPQTAATPDCLPSELLPGASLTVMPGASVNAADFTFTGCQ